jgi:PAS domain S-box-containing protein
MFDHDLRYIVADGAGLAQVGLESSELVGRTVHELFPEEVVDVLEPLYRSALAGDERAETLIFANHDRRLRAVPIVDEHGRVEAGMVITQDITEQRRLEDALARSEQQRRMVQAEMLRAEAEERTRIAAELHDDSVQVLASSLITLDRLIFRLKDADDHGHAMAQQTRELLEEATNRTRRLMFELRPALLEANGVGAAVRAVTEDAAAEAGFEASFDISLDRYDDATEQLLYRTVVEALSNVRKHAGASCFSVTLQERDGFIEGQLRDDGAGFDVRRALDRERMRLHLGLDTMIERARLAGGELSIDSVPGVGTTVRFWLPARERDEVA